jgi:hypothetical protein
MAFIRYNSLTMFYLVIISSAMYFYIFFIYCISISCLDVLFLILQKVCYIVAYIIGVPFSPIIYRKLEIWQIQPILF